MTIEERLAAAEKRRQAADTERKAAARDLRELILEARDEHSMSATAIAKAMGSEVGRGTVYRILGQR